MDTPLYRCSTCKSDLPREAFHKGKQRGGLQSECRECLAQRRARDKPRRLAYDNAYYQRTKEQRATYSRNHSHVWRAAQHKRRFRKRQQTPPGHHFTSDQFLALCDLQGWRCAYCGTDITTGASVDHWIPVSRGGSNDISNIVASCLPCNWSKATKTGDELLIQVCSGLR